MTSCRLDVLSAVLLLNVLSPYAGASTISFSGDLRKDATVTACGVGCTLGTTSSDGDYAQYAANLRTFTISSASTVQAITFSYGGSVNGSGNDTLALLVPVYSFPPALRRTGQDHPPARRRDHNEKLRRHRYLYRLPGGHRLMFRFKIESSVV